MQTFETIVLERSESVVRITINRPKVLNALNLQVLLELEQAIEASKNARVLILQGAGEKAFVAGADIAAMQKLSASEALEFSRLGQKIFSSLENANFISIAKVQGFALGGGCELAMACDIILASEQAVFGQPEVDLGLIPGFGGTQRLVKRVGLAKAMAILVAGKKMKANEAASAGLVSEVCPAEQLEALTEKFTLAIVKAGPKAVSETKRLAQQAFESPLNQGLNQEAAVFANCFAAEEAREGMLAFLEKRKANFS